MPLSIIIVYKLAYFFHLNLQKLFHNQQNKHFSTLLGQEKKEIYNREIIRQKFKAAASSWVLRKVLKHFGASLLL